MRLEEFLQNLGRAFGEAVAENSNFKFYSDGGEEPGQTLGELDMGGPAPAVLKVALHRGDVVRVVESDTLSIDVDGESEAADSLRFSRSEGALRIMRRRGGDGGVTLTVGMAAPSRLAIAGSGTIEAAMLAKEAKVAIGGSGTIRIAHVAGDTLVAKIGGSGRIEAAGEVDHLDLSIGGSGKLDAKDLEVSKAEIKIGGSGKAKFSSDGEVDAKIGGVGDILVYGSPRCSIKAGGAGRLRCEPRKPAEPIVEIAE